MNTLSEGDVINIKTEPDLNVDGFDNPFSCIVTILIELDPF